MGVRDIFSNARSNRLPDYGRAYFQHVLAALELTTANGQSLPEYVQNIVDHYFKDPDAIKWGELYLLEKYTLSVESGSTLKRRAWSLRSEFCDLVGSDNYGKYLQSQPPNENDVNCDLELLRADLDRILDVLHWSYSLIPIRERLRTGILKSVGWAVVLFAVVTLFLIVVCSWYYETLFAALLISMLAGSIGGFISLQQRLQTIPSDGDPLISIFELENGRFSIFQSPISGAVFAIVLFFLFMGGLVSGQLFPTFSGLKLYLHKFQWNGGYLWGAEYAKLIVWSFIAGFAERFVPDTLDRLIARGQDTSKATGSAANTGQVLPNQNASPPISAGLRGLRTSPPESLRQSPPWR